MDPPHPLDQLHGDAEGDACDIVSWVAVCPGGPCRVQQKLKHRGSQQTPSKPAEEGPSRCSPRLGSLCCVRAQLMANVPDAQSLTPAEGEEEQRAELPLPAVPDVAFQRCQDSLLQVPLGTWMTLRLGEGQCDITEASLENMRAGETSEILLSPTGNERDVLLTHPALENLPLRATIELRAFTPGKESWEMLPHEKWEWIKSHKERGGMRFRSGDVWGAADSYSRALRLLIPLQSHVKEMENLADGTEKQGEANNSDETRELNIAKEYKTIKAELHSNLSLCQLKLKQPRRAKASATKATQLEPHAAKAWYRLGQACQMVNELEEARWAFANLLRLQPESPAALKALRDVASREKETNAQLGQRLRKMFS